MDQLSMHAAFFFIPFSDREWKTVNPDSDSKCSPIMIEEKKWYWISVVFLIVPTAFFVFFGSAQWYDISAHCQKEGKKNRLTCVTFGILCFNGFALCPVFLRDSTTVSHVCATDLKISQLWVLLALRFIILGHAVCDSYSCIGSLLKQGPPFPLPNSIYFCWWSRRPGELWELISKLVSD